MAEVKQTTKTERPQQSHTEISSLQFRAFTTSTPIGYELICYRLRSSNFILAPAMLQDPEGAGDAVEDPFSDEERDTTDDETDAEATSAEEPWCPPVPDTPDDPTEDEIAGAADKLETMMNGSQPQANIFFQPDNLGALPALWLQAKLTISLTIQDKFAKLFMTIAAELWLRGCIETLEAVFQAAPRNFTIRLAEKLAKYLCSLMRRAETLGGPVKVVVTNQPHSRPNAGIDLVSGVSALLSVVPGQLGE